MIIKEFHTEVGYTDSGSAAREERKNIFFEMLVLSAQSADLDVQTCF